MFESDHELLKRIADHLKDISMVLSGFSCGAISLLFMILCTVGSKKK